jgi:Archaeal putative transposase ISC1217
VEVVTGPGQWYRIGAGLGPIRWVFVHELTGTHRDASFFTTDRAMTPQQLIETYPGRWSLETTFQELRAYLGLETPRGRTEMTVVRMAPCLCGLFSVVALL